MRHGYHRKFFHERNSHGRWSLWETLSGETLPWYMDSMGDGPMVDTLTRDTPIGDGPMIL